MAWNDPFKEQDTYLTRTEIKPPERAPVVIKAHVFSCFQSRYIFLQAIGLRDSGYAGPLHQ